jgi:hypothetical protein
MALGFLVLVTALVISAVAIYYSVAGLVAIFAAAAFPIMIMGGALEIAKLVTAVWLHKYWNQASWWLKYYLATAVVVLMFITSMGIFGFLSKAHIEQTSAAQEGVAQIVQIDGDLSRQQEIIERAEQRIVDAEASVGNGNDSIQAQIEKEQQRIDTAYDRIQPAIDEQNDIITNVRSDDVTKLDPYNTQLEELAAELIRLNEQAVAYELRIDTLEVDVSAIEPILAQLTALEQSISLVQGQIAGNERDAVKAAQTTIGVKADGAAGPATKRAVTAWIATQKENAAALQSQIVEIRTAAQEVVNVERTRLTSLVTDIQGPQTKAIKDRQLEVLATIDTVRNTVSPRITAAREEIARIRTSADTQIAASNELIQKLRDSLTVGKDDQVEQIIEDQQAKIVKANNNIDTLTSEKYDLQAEYRKLEAEVGPVKYLAEFIYGETANQDILEEAVRWVILIIIFVFDPLAVLLLIASQKTFEMRRDENQKQERIDFEHARAQAIVNNPGFSLDSVEDKQPVEDNNDTRTEIKEDVGNNDIGTNDQDGSTPTGVAVAREEVITPPEVSEGDDNGTPDQTTNSNIQDDDVEHNERDGKADDEASVLQRSEVEGTEEQVPNSETEQLAIGLEKPYTKEDQAKRSAELAEKEQDVDHMSDRSAWKQDNPNETLKIYRRAYIEGKIKKLPWEGYQQNAEQDDNSLFKKLRDNEN